jgi:hypothetical protein
VKCANFSRSRNKCPASAGPVLVDLPAPVRIQLAAVEFPMTELSSVALELLLAGSPGNPRHGSTVQEIDVTLHFFRRSIIPIGKSGVKIPAAKARTRADRAEHHFGLLLAEDNKFTQSDLVKMAVFGQACHKFSRAPARPKFYTARVGGG